MHFRRLLLPSGVGVAVLLAGLLPVTITAPGCVNQEDNATASRMRLTELVAYWAVRGRDSEGNNYIRPAVRFLRAALAADPPILP